MALPIVAIVGRPNVGKSSLFNTLAGRRISIVDPTAGVTRDRVSTPIEHNNRHFELTDTGGMGIVDVDDLTKDVERQIQYAIDSAHVVVFVVDIRTGVVPLDQTVAERLRVLDKPMIFVANKADDSNQDPLASDLFRLGFGAPILVSANSRRGAEELMFSILEKLPDDIGNVAPQIAELKVAIVGRRNVGKSTFINSLANEERVIVSEVAGTTRDSIDVRFQRDGRTYIAIDTAGIRKKGSLSGDIDFYSLHRAERSIRRADIVMHFFDARLRIGRVDKQLAEYIAENHKPAIFVVNKWDLVKHAMETQKMADYIREVFSMLDFVPIAFVTAKKGKNTLRLLNLAQQLHKQSHERISTGEINRIFKHALALNVPPVRHGRVAKVYYAAQVGITPPTVAMMTNGPELFDHTYLKYLTKVLRDSGPFGEVPIKLILRARGESTGMGGKRPAPEFDEFAEEPILRGGEDDTDIDQELSAQEPVDELDAQQIDDQKPLDNERPRKNPPEPKAPPKAPAPKRTPPVPRSERTPRKKKSPGVWDL